MTKRRLTLPAPKRLSKGRRCVHACIHENNHDRKHDLHWIRVLEMDRGHGVDLPDSNPYYCGGPDQLTDEQQAILADPASQYPLYPTPSGDDDDDDDDPASKPAGPAAGCQVPRPGKFYMPVACQQCRNPPCVKTCPVGATWQEPDGVVVIDYDWCLGCRCCMAACPYGARHFNWAEPEVPKAELNPKMHVLGNRTRPKGVVEKCTFCIHRTREGKYPACVEICPVGARKFGNLLDARSEVRQVLESQRIFVFKQELATEPKFYFFWG